jgi:hypothetical protein
MQPLHQQSKVWWVAGESNPAIPGKSRICLLKHLRPVVYVAGVEPAVCLL